MILFRCKLSLDHHAIKKNSREIMRNRDGRPFLGKSRDLAIAEQILIRKLMIEKYKAKMQDPITCDIQISFIFGFKNYFTKKGERNKKLGDLSNLYQLPEDCLTKAGIILDDNQIQSHDGSRRLPGDENYLIIIIEDFT